MNIAIIGSGNVGGALAQRFIDAGHQVFIGAKFPLSEKSLRLANKIGQEHFMDVESAVAQSSIIILATPASAAVDVTKRLGDTTGKVIIDTMNIGRGTANFSNTADVILAHTNTRDVVKCFNATGYENMLNPDFGGTKADMFMAGNSLKGKGIASVLAKDIGFGECYDLGGNDKFALLEQMALTWITLALSQGYGRGIAMKVIKR